ncbi:MAG: ROK family protein [Verrucomicrobia bacterium]|nr:MAG: ROK family protein [Verrucomicrobiota bacterium]
MKAAPTLLACDVGGTRIKVGLVRGGRLLARREIDARASGGLGPALERIVRAGVRCCREAGVPRSGLGGVGLSFPGIIEPGTGRILSTPAGKFDDARTIDVARWVEGRLGVPTLVCNDANAALAGEWRGGAARGFRSVVMMTLGTGIGTSAIIDGVPLRGQHGQAGCLGGHWVLNVDGDDCPCGNRGCAETEASTWALPGRARAHPDFPSSRLARAGTLDYAAVFRAAAAGDAMAIELRDRAIRVWAATVVSLIHAYDPECVVIGGGIMRSGAILLPRLRRRVARLAWTPWGKPKVRASALGNDAALLGVAALFGENR